ncbi:phytoene desaturase [Dictyobacter vulcani]|uniref:Phytoene desaturase n=1 Tax=Dictyobacter vulcani TaxID=2607529 RepID=A0A5J4KL46_9CHLR|nr:phytoene/squalene synthase family protein [Dictyobacter vulcani]GER88503.1 phytoene desaturase [Dictyobacter vulcani]
MRQGQRVTDAYEYCRQVTQRASKTFYWGSVFLPPHKRQAVWAIYAFCRRVDDIVDEAAEDSTPAVGHLRGSSSPAQALEGWRQALTRLYERGTASDEPILQAWEHMLEQYSVPFQPVLDLLDGVEMDLTRQRYQNFEELSLYCYRVAGTVGLMTSPIFGYEDESALPYAVDLGIALQLTNILRDIGEDARRNRIYLPADEMERFGYREADLMAGVINDAFRELVRFQMGRADEYYQRGTLGIELLDADCRLAVRLSGTLYQRILDRICANNFNVFTMRASVPLQTKLMTASTHWFMQQFDLHTRGSHSLRSQQSAVSSHH